jgi:hypothetical protein
MRAPELPMGWPRAMAPPRTLTRVGVELEGAHAGEGLRGEGLVELDEIDVGDGACPRRARSFCTAGMGPVAHEVGLDARGGAAEDARQGLEPAAFTTTSSEARSSAEAPSLIGEELPAVTLPPARKTGLSLASAATDAVRAHALVAADDHGIAFFLGDGDGDQLAGEVASLPGGGGALVREGGEGVLIVAGDLVFFGHVLGRLAHGLQLEARGHAWGSRSASRGWCRRRGAACDRSARPSWAWRRGRGSCSPRRRRWRTRPRPRRSSARRRPRPRGPIRRGG